MLTLITILEKLAATWIYRTMLLKQNQIKPNTLQNYFFAFKFYYINRCLNLKNFGDSQIAFIIKSEKKLFFNKKQTHLLIIKDTVKKIIENKFFFIIDLNIDTIFKIV